MYKENNYAKIIIVGLILIGAIGVVYGGKTPLVDGSKSLSKLSSKPTALRLSTDNKNNCRETSKGYFDCSTPEAKEAAKKVKVWYLNYATINAISTAYSPYESGQINARGLRPVEGKSVACPRRLSLGTRIMAQGQYFVCDDRTSRRFDGRFDFWRESRSAALNYGRKIIPITIFYAN